jgi:hypothetical protein
MKRTVLAVLALLATACPVAGADGSGRLDVDYRASRLSVDASGQTLAQILAAVGAKVGFTVVDTGAPSGPMTVSIRDASVEDALRQLLRGTNHSLVYLEETSPGAAPIDKIVLLGAPGSTQPPSTSPDRQSIAAAPEPAGSGPLANNQSVGRPQALDSGSPVAVAPYTPQAPAPFTPQWSPLLSWDPGPNAEISNDPDASNVGDLLRLHAQSGTQVATMPDNAQPPAAPVGSLEASLAETTRRAQQDLAALVKGLAAATRALQDSLVDAPK